MPDTAHLWAVGYDNPQRAQQVRTEIIRLGEQHLLTVLDTAVVVRDSDGSVAVDRAVPRDAPATGSLASLFARLAMSVPPLTESAVDFVVSAGHCADPTAATIPTEFVRNVQQMVTPGTSALFVLDEVGELDIVLRDIRGLGGTVLKTNVDFDRVKLVQSTLRPTPDDRSPAS